MTDNEPLQRRRSTDREIAQIDKRLGFIERDVEKLGREQVPDLLKRLDAIREAMAEPEQSALGRSLLGRAVTNAENIKLLDARMDEQEKRANQQDGAAKFARWIQIVLAIAVALLTLVTIASRQPV